MTIPPGRDAVVSTIARTTGRQRARRRVTAKQHTTLGGDGDAGHDDP